MINSSNRYTYYEELSETSSVEMSDGEENSGFTLQDLFNTKVFKAFGIPTDENQVVEGQMVLGYSEFDSQVLNLYTSSAHKIINSHLRDQRSVFEDQVVNIQGLLEEESCDFDSEVEIYREECDQISTAFISAIDKVPSYQGVVYRGDIWNDDELHSIIKGQYSDKGVMSCTKDRDAAVCFANRLPGNSTEEHYAFMTIYITEGKVLSDFSAFSFEEEVIIPPGTNLKVLSVANRRFYHQKDENIHEVYITTLKQA